MDDGPVAKAPPNVVRALVERLLERIAFPAAVWGCERGDIAGIADRPSRFFRKPDGSHSRSCYHPKHFVAPSRAAAPDDPERWPDPAAPHVMVQYVTRMVIRNALALATALGRRLVLPRSWSFCDRHWWQLRDCRVPGAETLALPSELRMANMRIRRYVFSVEGNSYDMSALADMCNCPVEKFAKTVEPTLRSP